MTNLSPIDKRPQTLYRLYSREGRLLYVGVTAIPEQRLRQHSRDKDWWGDVDIIRVEHYTDRISVEIAEIHAIHDERPVYNKSFSRDSWRVPYRREESGEAPATEEGDSLHDMIVKFLEGNGPSKTARIISSVPGVNKNNSADVMAALVAAERVTLSLQGPAKIYSASGADSTSQFE